LSLTFSLLRTRILFDNSQSMQGCYSSIPKTDDTSALTLIGSHRSPLFCRWGQSSLYDEAYTSLINRPGWNELQCQIFFCVRSFAENDQLFRRIISAGKINNWTPENSSLLGSKAVSVGFLRSEGISSQLLWNFVSCLCIDIVLYFRKARFFTDRALCEIQGLQYKNFKAYLSNNYCRLLPWSSG
jgi:hypothetical protein